VHLYFPGCSLQMPHRMGWRGSVVSSAPVTSAVGAAASLVVVTSAEAIERSDVFVAACASFVAEDGAMVDCDDAPSSIVSPV
jgi:hypothetical protein